MLFNGSPLLHQPSPSLNLPVHRSSLCIFTSKEMEFVGDLVNAESRKKGTRGGRANFKWDEVQNNDKSYYLGNSIAKPTQSRGSASNRKHDWYNQPVSPATVPAEPSKPRQSMEERIDDLQLVRNHEKAIMEHVLVGRSFPDAVRSALNEGHPTDIDDNDDPNAAAARRAARERRKSEKARRKQLRDQIRLQRRIRREKPQLEQNSRRIAYTSRHCTSESDVETQRPRYDDVARRRRRQGSENKLRRKRNEYSSSSESDTTKRRIRRQRLR